MITSRSLLDLDPPTRILAGRLIAACAEQGIHLLITCTVRDFEAQDALYALGRTLPGKRVTNARAGQSFHQYGVAFDVVPLIHGKAVWNDDTLWNRIGALGEAIGLEWAGRWKRFQEKAHFQYTQGHTLADFQANAGRFT